MLKLWRKWFNGLLALSSALAQTGLLNRAIVYVDAENASRPDSCIGECFCRHSNWIIFMQVEFNGVLLESQLFVSCKGLINIFFAKTTTEDMHALHWKKPCMSVSCCFGWSSLSVVCDLELSCSQGSNVRCRINPWRSIDVDFLMIHSVC